MTREFVVIPSFLVKWRNLGLNEADMRRLEQDILDNPKVGQVMKETGGVRKMRFAFENRGKSGSVRIIYVDFEVYEKVYLIDAYQKSEKDNLTKAERNDMKKIVELIELQLEMNERDHL
ncbi:MAG: type II toxin-antitoxin system RelE/ParE family toxin [Oscillospiraceae bacterium]|nr:type II toxin-antitoxin system RelE/ParE family toxin [Oscillospiraceae bacterium]